MALSHAVTRRPSTAPLNNAREFYLRDGVRQAGKTKVMLLRNAVGLCNRRTARGGRARRVTVSRKHRAKRWPPAEGRRLRGKRREGMVQSGTLGERALPAYCLPQQRQPAEKDLLRDQVRQGPRCSGPGSALCREHAGRACDSGQMGEADAHGHDATLRKIVGLISGDAGTGTAESDPNDWMNGFTG